MAKLYVSYRGEFGAEVEVEDGLNTMAKVDKAIKKFENGNCKIEPIGEGRWNEYFEVTDMETEQVLKETGQ